MELQALSAQSGADVTNAIQQQTIRPPERNEAAQQRERADSEQRVADRVTLSTEAHLAAEQQTSPLPRVEQTEPNAPARPPEAAEPSPRPEQTERQTQADGRPPARSVARALEAYTQTTLV